MRLHLLILALVAVVGAHAQQLPMRLTYNEAATHFEESLPLGNGRLGALIYGGADEDIVQLNDITLWSGKPIDRKEDEGASTWIPKIREALFNEDYKLADSLQLHVQGHNSSYYMPLGTLRIKDLSTGDVAGYQRLLSLDSALAVTTYRRGGQEMRREYLVSAPDKVVAIRLTSNSGGKGKRKRGGDINVRLMLQSLLEHSVEVGKDRLTMTGHALGQEQETIHFCTILKVMTDGTVEHNDSTLTIRDANSATIYIVNETSFNGFDKHPVLQGAPYKVRAEHNMQQTEGKAFSEVLNAHLADYKSLYDRVKLNIAKPASVAASASVVESAIPSQTTTALLQGYNTGNSDADRYLETLYFQFGRYLLISCSRTPSVPANLQGLWNPHLHAPWRGNYTLNINLEENYWPAFVANLTEMAMPLDGFVAALAENGRYTTNNYYGISRGWSTGHNSDIWAMANPVGEKREKPEWANWAFGGAWLVETLWEKYLFTQDKDYLRSVAYPLMRGAAEFCLDWLIPNPNNPEELITAPSTSPENEYLTDKDYHGMTCYGTTADMAIIRELFINTLAAARILDETELTADIQSALSRLHPYTVGQGGDLNEWYHDWRDKDPHHRHQSHLVGLYPFHHLDQSFYPAATQTLVERGEMTTGWSTGWRINLWTRLHRADQAYHIYQKLLEYVAPGGRGRSGGGGTYPNLFDAHPPFQIDGNFGGTAGVCEMLLQSRYTPSNNTYSIELLPALPHSWACGEVSGLRARGGYEVDIKWNSGIVTAATIKASHDGELTITYNGKVKTISLKAGETVELTNRFELTN